MACRSVLPAWLLLLWTLTACVGAADDPKKDVIEVKKLGGNKIELVCPGLTNVEWNKDGAIVSSPVLEYEDQSSGEYTCHGKGSESTSEDKTRTIYVKIRTCDNCVELDQGSVCGLLVGDLVATFVIGVAVYLIASQAPRIDANISAQKKSSDRQHLVPNEMSGRASNEHYERLRHKGQRETYDVINKR